MDQLIRSGRCRILLRILTSLQPLENIGLHIFNNLALFVLLDPVLRPLLLFSPILITFQLILDGFRHIDMTRDGNIAHIETFNIETFKITGHTVCLSEIDVRHGEVHEHVDRVKDSGRGRFISQLDGDDLPLQRLDQREQRVLNLRLFSRSGHDVYGMKWVELRRNDVTNFWYKT